ncbi:MAG: peptidoglycan editing factor PgeF [Butyricicoccaceae bacterium]
MEQFQRVTSGELVYYRSTLLDTPHMFTTKAGGVSQGYLSSLNLGSNRGDDPACVAQNYRIISQELHTDADRITRAKQVHGDEVIVVDESNAGRGSSKPKFEAVDALVTNLPNTPLIGFYADCVLTMLYDPVSRCIGVCHSGWRGTANGILKKTVRTLREAYGARPENIRAVIGPSIRQCCFETDRDVPDAMREAMGDTVQPYIREADGKYWIDLQGINAAHLKNAGVTQIHDSGLCTKCRSGEFWSHRATNGKRGVQGGIILLREETT